LAAAGGTQRRHRRRGAAQLLLVLVVTPRSSPSTSSSTGRRMMRALDSLLRSTTATRCAPSPARSTRRWPDSSAASRWSACSSASWYGLGLTLIGLDFRLPHRRHRRRAELRALCGFADGAGAVGRRQPRAGLADLKLFALALGVVGSGQFLEGNVISPKLVGGSIACIRCG